MLVFGLKVSLIGMGTVFFALVLLVFIIRGVSMAASTLDRRKSPVPAAPTGAAAAPEDLARDTSWRADEGELAAVISVVVSAYRRGRG